jgi:trans-aconitate 2-methyltransferase
VQRSGARDPTTYLRFAGERARPFAELLSRVGADAPRVVVDRGCGDGSGTARLAQRWPGARITGVDSSPAMLTAAAAHAVPDAEELAAEYAAALRAAYPVRADGTTVLPFRRLFAVGHRPS